MQVGLLACQRFGKFDFVIKSRKSIFTEFASSKTVL